jgi:DNA-binding transcriptional ArsR family regulator
MPDEISAAPAPLRSVQPSSVFQALGNGTRQTMIRHLATGATLCVKDFVPLTQMTQDGVCRHIGVLLRAGIVEPVPPPDGDRRKSCYRIVPQFLVVRNGLVELDCGAGVVRLNLPAKMAEA